MAEMTYDEWKEKYIPIENPNTFAGVFSFEDCEADIEFLKHQNPACIWTEVEVDGYYYIVNGTRVVNRIEYHVTKVPYEGVSDIWIIASRPEDWEDAL